MNRILPVAFVLLALVACAYKHQPVYGVDKPLPVSAQTLGLNRIESMIIDAGTALAWRFQRAGEGHLIATQQQPKFSAVVDIYFNQQTYKIVKNSTTGLNDQGATIHAHYNIWIQNLERNIDARLAQAQP